MDQENYLNYYSESTRLVDGFSVIQDYHLVLRYYKDEITWGINAPRTNRLFINRDVENTSMDRLLSTLEDAKVNTPQILAISGF